jgi:Domain of unknown function (DUF4326)
MPVRVQRKRTKGWEMPQNTVYVGRPSGWGNPFRAKDAENAGYRDGNKMAAWAYGEWLRGSADFANYEPGLRSIIKNLLPELRGKNLACWCPLVDKDGKPVPCHADVLLELANQ